MDRFSFTLLSDGSSDRALIPIMTWVLQHHGQIPLAQGQWADLGVLRARVTDLAERMRLALELYPCELLCVHRDAEKQEPQLRYQEVGDAWRRLNGKVSTVPLLCVVPVRMQEAWLLSDEGAIRTAAGNPRGKEPLSLPGVEKLESLADPKEVLHTALRRASGLTGRRLKTFDPRRHCLRVAEFAAEGGFASLLATAAFQRLVADVATLKDRNWGRPVTRGGA